MSTPQPIKTLFANDIERTIEEVIKVDQRDEQILVDEIAEYVVTNSIRSRFTSILEAYQEAPNKPTDGVGVWVSGFYGSGKSSFAKNLGLAIQNRTLGDIPASQRLADRAGDQKLTVLLKQITEKIPTHAVIFDVSTDRGIRSGNQTLTEIAYGLLLQSLGYAKDLDLSELEIALEADGRLIAFEDAYRRIYSKEWSAEKGKVAFAIGEASRVMHELEPETYPSADSWSKAARGRGDITPGLLAERAKELMERRKRGESLLFVIDEVGQFVARDVQKMLDLQAIVQQLGIKGRGKMWLVVTSQERLGELVSGLDDKRVEHARLMDRFPQTLQVHLEPSDISEVTSRRVLSKNADAQATLGALFDEHRTRLTEHTRLTADVRLPELTRDRFIDLYPLLPYEIDLIISVVSGLRTQGGTSPHVGGANRTIIKLAQQLLINQEVALADQSVGALARLDHVYDLVAGNISSEVRAKISSIPSQLSDAHPLAQSVAKVICLLQYVKSVHRTAENIAACLHPHVAADSQLASVQQALVQLEAAHLVRKGDDGYRIPTPAEDDWERIRNGSYPKPGDANRIYQEVMQTLWEPQPSHALLGIKPFKGGLAFKGRPLVEGDITFQVHLADEQSQLDSLAGELRGRSRDERSDIFWAAALDDGIDHALREYFRSRTVIEIKEREARTAAETALVAEERQRRESHLTDLKRRLARALLAGMVYFRGNDRSPGDGATDVAKAASSVLAEVTPQIFERFGEAAGKTADANKGLNDLLKAENLKGLPAVFTQLGLVAEDQGKIVFSITRPPLSEVLARIQSAHDYGQALSGKGLTDLLAKEPYGWDFEVVRLLALCLLRSGSVAVTSKGQTIDSVTGPDAAETFSNNQLFRQASLRPQVQIVFEHRIKAAQNITATFGVEAPDLTQSALVAQLRQETAKAADRLNDALFLLTANTLPGTVPLLASLDATRSIAHGSEENAITTFNSNHATIRDAMVRAAELTEAVTQPRLVDISRARNVLDTQWPALREELDLPESIRNHADELKDLLAREDFFKHFPAIDQAAAKISSEFGTRHSAALAGRVDAYQRAIEILKGTPGWSDLEPNIQQTLLKPLEVKTYTVGMTAISLQQLRSETEVCPNRLAAAQNKVAELVSTATIEQIDIRPYFAGGIETEEQLQAALDGIREACAKLIGEGKKIVLG